MRQSLRCNGESVPLRVAPVPPAAAPAGMSTASKDSLFPGAGEHDLAIWLEDEAGNHDYERARHVRLRLDTEAPELAFSDQMTMTRFGSQSMLRQAIGYCWRRD